MALFIVTAPLIKFGHCFGTRGASKRWLWVSSASGAWSSGIELVKTESWATWVGNENEGNIVKAKGGGL